MAATISEKLRPRDLPLTGLVPGHAYTVTKAFEQDGVEFVEVRNPWGAQPPISTPRGVIDSNGGTFTLTMEEFKAGFPAAFIAD